MKHLLLSLIGCFMVLSSTAQNLNNIILTTVSELNLGFNTQNVGFGNIEAVNPGHGYAASHLRNPALMSSTHKTWNTSANFFYTDWTYYGSVQVAYQNKNGLSYGGLMQTYVLYPDVSFLINNQTVLVTENTFTTTLGGFIAKKLGKHWSIGTSLNFLYAKLSGLDLLGGEPMPAFYMDLGLHYKTTFDIKDKGLAFSSGLMINHIGPKPNNFNSSNPVNYPLPTQLALAAALTYPVYVNKYKIASTFAYQAEKLLVPTPSSGDADNNGISDYLELSAFRGMVTSFSDATYDGEEWDEINHRFGLEVLAYSDKWVFGLRAGALREAPNKGRRSDRMIGFTIGRNGYLIHGSYTKSRFNRYSISFNRQI